MTCHCMCRAGQNLKGYFEEGRDYLSCFKLLFLAYYLVGKQGSFSHGKFPKGSFQDLLFHFWRKTN